MKKIYEYIKAPSGSIRPVCYLSPVIDSEGKIYSIFLLHRYVSGYGTYVYDPCVSFEANSFNGDWIDTPFSNTLTKIEGREVQYNGNTTNVYADKQGYINRSFNTFHDFNSEKKLAIKCINGFTNGSTSFSLFTPTDNQPNFEYRLYLPVIDYDSADFWDKVQKIPKPKLAFEIDTSTEGGGDGDYDDNSSDTIGLPDLTALNQNSISNTKFLTCYKMTPAQLSKLGDELWSDNIFTQISNTVLKPTDFIVNLSLLPVDVGGVTKLIKAGKILLNGAEGTLISQQFIRVDCGTLEVKKKWGGAIDYQTDVSIFLPFIGEQTLNANEVMGATLNVIYTVDILSGSCIASVRVIKDNLDAVLYQFTGNMASNYPITSADYATVFSGALQLAVGVGSLPSSGGVLSLVSATSNMLSGADVKRTGSLSSATGFMGIKKPYLILSRPIQSLAESYNHFNGYVSNIKMKLGDCNGFTKVDMVHLEAIPCMDEEKAEIESLLKSGVLIN